MAVTIRGLIENQFLGDLTMIDFTKIANEMRQAFTAGTPFKMPLMRFRDLDILFAMLD